MAGIICPRKLEPRKIRLKGNHAMKRILGILILIAFGMGMPTILAASDPQDAEGSKDPALFSRMPGFHIYNYKELEFDRYEFSVGPDRTEAVEGRFTYVDYYANEGITLPSGLQIVRNYVNAAKAVGGKVLYVYDDGGVEHVILKVAKNNAEVWAAVEAGGNGMYKIFLIEKQAMNQEVVADASSLAGSIRETGKAAVYGIYFDTDKSDIKPESAAAVAEIAKLLKTDPGLKLYVVGHTDNTGAFDHNVRLSQARAAAVVSALVAQHGIAAARLTPFGDGPTAPVASNRTEEGRTRNRRVELVAQ
jgi:OmpA-OmpF porin, OOP family